jgi:arylsulfatase
MLVPAGAIVAQYMQTLMEFPPRQRPDSFTVGDVMAKLEAHRKALEVGSGGAVK